MIAVGVVAMSYCCYYSGYSDGGGSGGGGGGGGGDGTAAGQVPTFDILEVLLDTQCPGNWRVCLFRHV